MTGPTDWVRHAARADWPGAAAALRHDLARDPSSATGFANLGAVLVRLGDPAGAVVAFRRALALGLDDPGVRYNLGTALRHTGDAAAAAAALRAALACAPGHADAHNNLGNALRDLDRPGAAVAAYRRAIRLAPSDGGDRSANLAAALTLLAERDLDAARRAAADWRAEAPDDPFAVHGAAALEVGPVPARAGDAYVRGLFDRFADEFDARLDRLGYRAPALLADALASAHGPPTAAFDLLDAGCGTGRAAAGFRPFARRLVGVDLSPAMAAHARATGLYDAVEIAELGRFLAAHPAAFDVIVAADVLVYFGPLDAIAGAAATAVRAGGRWLFTVEHDPDQDDDPRTPPRLGPGGRYRHGIAHLRAALAGAGFEIDEMRAVTLRHEGGRPVAGYLVAARRPGPTGTTGDDR